MKKDKKPKKDPVLESRERPPETEEPLENQSLSQKKIAFAQSTHLEAVLAILKDACGEQKLLGETEFETVKNAITLDTQANVIKSFITLIDHIKSGGLHK